MLRYLWNLVIAGSWGQEFYVAILGPSKKRSGLFRPDDCEISLFIRSTATGHLHVLSPGTNQSLSYNISKGTSTVKLPPTLIQDYPPPATQKKAVKLTSTVPLTMTARLSSKGHYSNCYRPNVRVLPVSYVSTHYIVPYCDHGNTLGQDINLIGLNKTRFNITYTLGDETYVVPGHLGPFDSFILHNSSVTKPGISIVSSTEPVAVFSYNIDGYAQQIPGGIAGYKFIIPYAGDPYPKKTKFRVLALQDETRVKTSFGSETVVMKVDRGKYIESELGSTATLSSNQPIVVMQYKLFYSISERFMAALPDVSQFAQEYSLLFDSSSVRYVSIIIQSAFEKQLIFSESYIPEWIKTEHVDLDGVQYFIGTTKLYGTGLHRISVDYPSGRFGGIVSEDSEFYPLGMPQCGC